jgi:hypothetical protein
VDTSPPPSWHGNAAPVKKNQQLQKTSSRTNMILGGALLKELCVTVHHRTFLFMTPSAVPDVAVAPSPKLRSSRSAKSRALRANETIDTRSRKLGRLSHGHCINSSNFQSRRASNLASPHQPDSRARSQTLMHSAQSQTRRRAQDVTVFWNCLSTTGWGWDPPSTGRHHIPAAHTTVGANPPLQHANKLCLTVGTNKPITTPLLVLAIGRLRTKLSATDIPSQVHICLI